MGNLVKRINGTGDEVSPKIFRPDSGIQYSASTRQKPLGLKNSSSSNSQLLFQGIVAPALILERAKKLPLNERYLIYGQVFKMFFYIMEKEAEGANLGLGYSEEKVKACLVGLEYTRRMFREDFPHEEFPI